MTTYSKNHAAWEDSPSTDTPITAAKLDNIEEGIETAAAEITTHVADSTDAHDASAISVVDEFAYSSATNVQDVLDDLDAAITSHTHFGIRDDFDAHLVDTSAAHAASAISVDASGFDGNLDTSDVTVQMVAQKLDDLTVGGSDSVDAIQNAFVNGTPFEPAPMQSPPTITLSAAGAGSAIGSSAVVTPNDAAFTYLGAAMSNVGTLGSFSNCYRQNSATLTNTGQVGAFLNLEFETDASDFEVILRSEDTTYARYRVWVNGEPAANHAQVGTSGSYYRVRVTFGASVARRIRIEGQGVSFCGIAKVATRTIWKSVRDTGPLCVAVSDSYGSNWDGATASTLWVWDSFIVRAGRYLGWNVYPSAVGGTGFTSTNGGSNVKFGSRLTSDVVNLAPDIVVVVGSINDQSLTLATVQSDVNSYFSTLRAALPAATIYGVGGITSLDSSTNMGTISGYISTACSANTCNFIASVDWINGTGYAGATSGVGNSDFFTAADGVHLTTAGYTYIAERLVAALGVNVGRRARPVRFQIPLLYAVGKECVVETDVFRWHNKTGQTLTIDKVWASIGTPPTGSSLIVDVNKNGTTTFTTTGNRPTISASGYLSTTALPDVRTVEDGDYITFDVDQVGSTVKGSYLTITVLLSVA